MIYIFTWEKLLIDREVKVWYERFKQKFDELNIIKIKNPLDYDFNFYAQNLLWGWLFSTKKLIIIYDLPASAWDNDKKDLEEYIYNICNNIWKDNIVLFVSPNPDKRWKLYKYIQKNHNHKHFSLKEGDIIPFLQKEYWDSLKPWVIKKLIEMKKWNFSLIKNDLDKLFITKDTITLDDLDNLTIEIDDNIFDIVWDILNTNYKWAILKLRDLYFKTNNFYLLYNSLVSNLRVHFYIYKLKQFWVNSSDIKDYLKLWNRWFLVDRKNNISPKDLFKIYKNLINIDSQIKTWNLISNDSLGQMYALERSILFVKG